MSVDVLSLYSDKKISMPNLAAVVMRRGKDLFWIGGDAIVDMERSVIAL